MIAPTTHDAQEASVKSYAGIGSRETPPDVLLLMEQVASRLAHDGWTLRSGGAQGADLAFQRGHLAVTEERYELFRPDMKMPDWCFSLAEEYHPAWDRCSIYARRLHARNGQIVLGSPSSDPAAPIPAPAFNSRFVLCWTKGGTATGGTGQGLRLAEAFEIPVFNLAHPKVRARLANYVTQEVIA